MSSPHKLCILLTAITLIHSVCGTEVTQCMHIGEVTKPYLSCGWQEKIHVLEAWYGLAKAPSSTGGQPRDCGSMSAETDDPRALALTITEQLRALCDYKLYCQPELEYPGRLVCGQTTDEDVPLYIYARYQCMQDNPTLLFPLTYRQSKRSLEVHLATRYYQQGSQELYRTVCDVQLWSGQSLEVEQLDLSHPVDPNNPNATSPYCLYLGQHFVTCSSPGATLPVTYVRRPDHGRNLRIWLWPKEEVPVQARFWLSLSGRDDSSGSAATYGAMTVTCSAWDESYPYPPSYITPAIYRKNETCNVLPLPDPPDPDSNGGVGLSGDDDENIAIIAGSISGILVFIIIIITIAICCRKPNKFRSKDKKKSGSSGSSLDRPSSKSSTGPKTSTSTTTSTVSTITPSDGSDTYAEIPSKHLPRQSLKAKAAPAPPPQRRRSKQRQIPSMDQLGPPDLIIDSTDAIYVDIDEYKQQTSGYYDEEPPQQANDIQKIVEGRTDMHLSPSVKQYSYDNPEAVQEIYNETRDLRTHYKPNQNVNNNYHQEAGYDNNYESQSDINESMFSYGQQSSDRSEYDGSNLFTVKF